jgi:hypothetical protein
MQYNTRLYPLYAAATPDNRSFERKDYDEKACTEN